VLGEQKLQFDLINPVNFGIKNKNNSLHLACEIFGAVNFALEDILQTGLQLIYFRR